MSDEFLSRRMELLEEREQRRLEREESDLDAIGNGLDFALICCAVLFAIIIIAGASGGAG